MKNGIFPGQGNQYVGMGKDLYDKYHLVKEMYEEANRITGIDVKGISFEGPKDIQRETQNTQLITFVHSCVVHRLLIKVGGVIFSHYAGHSVGEYPALVSAGVFPYEIGLQIVKKRGELMGGLKFEGDSLVVVQRASREEVETFCRSTNGELEVALYNAPGVYVIGGHPNAIGKRMEGIPGKKTPLRVSGPFHTKQFQDVSAEFNTFLERFQFLPPRSTVYSNVSASPYGENEIKEGLVKQMYNPVKWEDIVFKMEGDFIEMGPGNSLSIFCKKIKKGSNVQNVQDLESLVAMKGLSVISS